MPRIARNTSQAPKPAVIHQTIEVPATPAVEEQETKEARPDFWTYMHTLTPEEWKDHIVYLTREQPKYNIAAGGGGYLTKFVQPFDLEDVKQLYGGYEFSYIMNKGRKIVYSGNFRIEAPPRIDPQRESVPAGDQSNIAQQFISMLREELGRMRESLANGGDDAGAGEKAIEMLSKASDKAMDVILKQVPDAGKGNAGGGDQGIIATIKILKELGLIGQPQPAIDPMKQLEMMLSIFSKIDEIRGNGGGGGGRRSSHWWDSSLAEKAVDAIPGLLDTFKETREANMRIASDRARASDNLRAIGRQPAAPAPGAQPAATAQPATAEIRSSSGLHTVPLERGDVGAYAVPDTQPDAAVPETVIVETIDRNTPAFDNFLKQGIVEAIYRGDHGEPIVDFLDVAKPGFSNVLVQYAPEQLTAFFGRDPILQAAVKHPNWLVVLEEARKYIITGEQADEDQELETATVAGARRGKPN